MAPPKTTLWPLERHTAAKHQILRRYLDAWIPIMAYGLGRQLILIDGFAGPGRYTKNEPGSPIQMMQAFTDHKQRDTIEKAAQLTWVFIERKVDRAEHLEEEVDDLRKQLPIGWLAEVRHGDFADEMAPLAKRIGAANPIPPTFLFIDPFGYAEPNLELSAQVLGYPHCEVLIFVPIENIARFITEGNVQDALTNLFAGDTWRSALAESTVPARIDALREIYIAKLRKDAQHVRSFAIRSDDSEYALFFASNHPLGIDKMKDAMWSVDPIGGTTYTDATAPGQVVLFDDAPDISRTIEAMLRSTFGASWFYYRSAMELVRETPYLEKHLRRELTRLLAAKEVHVLPGTSPFDDKAYWSFPPKA